MLRARPRNGAYHLRSCSFSGNLVLWSHPTAVRVENRTDFGRHLAVSAIRGDTVFLRPETGSKCVAKDDKFPFGYVKIQVLIGL